MRSLKHPAWMTMKPEGNGKGSSTGSGRTRSDGAVMRKAWQMNKQQRAPPTSEVPSEDATMEDLGGDDGSEDGYEPTTPT